METLTLNLGVHSYNLGDLGGRDPIILIYIIYDR